MSLIVGFSDLLVKNWDKFENEKKYRYANIIHLSSHNIMEMLQNLLNWAISQTGGVIFRPEVLSFDEILEEIMPIFETTASLKEVTISKSINANSIFADKNMLLTIIRNLIANAIKFSETGGQIKLTTEQQDKFILISVSDEGIGLNEETRNNIFSSEIVKSETGTGGEKGTGLGLSICKEFVTKHGGTIYAENNIPCGSKFVFSIPAYEADFII